MMGLNVHSLTPQIILIEQLLPLLGLNHLVDEGYDVPELPIPKLIFTIQHIKLFNPYTMTLSLSCLAFLILSKIGKGVATKRPGGKWLRFVPEILVVVVSTTGEYLWSAALTISAQQHLPMGQARCRYPGQGEDGRWPAFRLAPQ